MNTIDSIKQNFSGEIIVQGDPEYVQASTVFAFKGSPAVIFRPATTEDVTLAILYAKDNSLTLSIRSGGHSNAGFSTNKDGVVIDISKINSVKVIDEVNNIVRIGAGAKWVEVAKEFQNHNLAITSGDTKTVGVGGLVLGGGIGWMVRKYGLTIDNLVAAEIVTADGRTLRTTEKENADLFWAIRGGGGNFGVVSYLEVKAVKVENVFFGTVMYAFEDLAKLLKDWSDYMRTADELLTTTFMIMPAMGPNPAGIMILVCYGSGDDAAAAKAIDPLKKLGKMNMQDINKMPYASVLQDVHAPSGVTIIVKSTFVEKFSDKFIKTIAESHGKESGRFLMIRSIGGAMNKVPADSTAFAYSNSEALLIAPMFLPPKATEEVIQKILKPWQEIKSFGKGAYAGFISTNTAEDVQDVYPKATYEKLAKIKKKYDPLNIFNQNYNIKPGKKVM
jgi:FAD/FMN-containing dehydrogenase